MVARGEIYWADLDPPAGRRPVCVLTRDAAAAVRSHVTCAPVTRTVRGSRAEVELGPDQGLPDLCVINCDNITTLPKWLLDGSPAATLDQGKRIELDRAIRYALDVIH